METLKNYVNGKFVESTSSETSDIVNPSTGKVYAKAPKSNEADVNEAMKAAAEAFEEWKETTPSERQDALIKIADAIEKNATKLIDAECQNTGKPRHLMESEEIPPMVDQIKFFAGAARNLEGKSAGQYMKGMFSIIVREPVGVCAQVTPWNYPLMMSVWKWAPALAAGNTVVLKPSETTPVSTLMLAEIMGTILPPGVFNVVCGERETGALLVTHTTPAMTSITGSVRAGKEVAGAAASTLKKVHLELGGKAPVVVFDDADLDNAAEEIHVAGYFNAGQDCTAATRVVCHESIYEEFISKLASKANSVKVGRSPTDGDALYGPLNSERQLKAVVSFFESKPDHVRIVTGGNVMDGPGFFFEPTIVADLQQDDEMIQKEIFGPVITVQKFATEDEAISMANGVNYGLASSIWTKDHGRAMRMSRAFDFGCVWINTHIPLVAEMPHGGFKQSGYGKDLSGYGLEDYTRIKHIMTNLG